MIFYDAHSHLHFAEFANLKFAENVVICASSASSEDMQLLVDFQKVNPKKVFAAFGFHPKFLNSFDEKKLVKFLDGACAVGEIGFDKFSNFDLQTQRNCFEAQLAIAIQRNLPAVIHQVGYWNELETSLKKFRPKKFLIHAVKCSVELVEKFKALGGYFSFGLRELETRAGQDALLAAGNRILLETDSNSNLEILQKTYLIAGEILKLKDIALLKQIEENFLEFFNNG